MLAPDTDPWAQGFWSLGVPVHLLERIPEPVAVGQRGAGQVSGKWECHSCSAGPGRLLCPGTSGFCSFSRPSQFHVESSCPSPSPPHLAMGRLSLTPKDPIAGGGSWEWSVRCCPMGLSQGQLSAPPAQGWFPSWGTCLPASVDSLADQTMWCVCKAPGFGPRAGQGLRAHQCFACIIEKLDWAYHIPSKHRWPDLRCSSFPAP